jgi:hypothetical protein
VEQALEVQRKSCLFHNSSEHLLSLYTDHRCSRDQIPTRTLQCWGVGPMGGSKFTGAGSA